MAREETASAEWKALLKRLPGIINIEFAMDGEEIRELHILANQVRAPKQIVRDVQSALRAQFSLEIDHRVISVAQISDEDADVLNATLERRLICEQLALSTARDHVMAQVTLSYKGQNHSGTAKDNPSEPDRQCAIACATTMAINQFLQPDNRFMFRELKTVPFGDDRVLLVGLQLKRNGASTPCVGACFEGEDGALSVTKATLDSVNRILSKLDFLPQKPDGGEPLD